MMGIYLLLYRYSSLNNDRCGGETIDYFIPVSSGGTTVNIDPMSYKSIEKIVDKLLPEGLDGTLTFPGNLTVNGDTNFTGNTTLLNDNQIHGSSIANEGIDVFHDDVGFRVEGKEVILDVPLVKCTENIMYNNSVSNVHRVSCMSSESLSYGEHHVIDFDTNVEFQGVLRIDKTSPLWSIGDSGAGLGDFYYNAGHLNVDTGGS